MRASVIANGHRSQTYDAAGGAARIGRWGPIHDDNAESGLLGRFSALPLEQMVAWYHQGEPGSYGWNDTLFEDNPVVFETRPHGHVRRVSRSDWWVTFAPDYGMNYAALDLDPASDGSYGQLLMFGRDVWGPIVYVAPSVRHVMRAALARLDTARPEEDPAWQQGETPNHQWSVEIAGADLAGLVATEADPSVIQSVHLGQADRVAFKDLAFLPHLRAIRVLDARQPATHVDLSIPEGLPVEQVDVAAGHFDPRLLATTVTLRYLTLAGNTARSGDRARRSADLRPPGRRRAAMC